MPLTLSTYYDALVENCWLWSCAVRDVPGTTATDLGDAVILDVLPGTLDEFVDVAGWASGDLALIARGWTATMQRWRTAARISRTISGTKTATRSPTAMS
ncbi:MAG: hypothetical protein R2854_05010 [Caldilineaceae bacterium]